ncbi:hypothetical protein MRU69_04460 [Kocuria flava]|uniref:hypothetical protein n=1 Tax=Kocuria flava TaxID=446860 RepID=UPI001FF39009|nr:hypothetical protein [Kocuria flava]MCJ8504119.1 hypothetical protein [Kocuria flava]
MSTTSSSLQHERTASRTASRTAAKGGIATAAVALGLLLGGLATMQALGYLGIYGSQADKIATAILNGMSIAGAIALFAGPIAIGAWVMWLLRSAFKNASKAALVF